ncbi:hypothetical protein H5410_009054 [Solanum commersonii]|uniref:Uncharacterized protein n=1 Tax=Solanum commersonii TaxID=4109 RepID=A0A9J6AHN4_SOLCO|nr:hypothetical protein H5410_009054 [Solanum commersonii]
MNSIGPRLLVQVDLKKKPFEQNSPLHNRWHLEIPPVLEVRVGEVFRVEMVDFSGGGITEDYTAEDNQSVVSSSQHSLISLCSTFITSIELNPLFRTCTSFVKENGSTRS